MNRPFALFRYQRSNFHCRHDVHRCHLHPGALRGVVLSATSSASTFRLGNEQIPRSCAASNLTQSESLCQQKKSFQVQLVQPHQLGVQGC